jgi:hypothetical protein
MTLPSREEADNGKYKMMILDINRGVEVGF